MAFAVPATPAMAQLTRTWVSGVGDDANPCTRTAPCKTFAGAIATKTSAGGEIDCLDPGEFGAVTITQSVTIDCSGGMGGGIEVTTPSNAITINTSSGAVIILRNLNLNGLGTIGASGISITSFPNGALILQHCTITGFPGAAINFTPNTGRGLLHMSDSSVFKNGVGVIVSPASGVIASAVFDRVEIVSNSTDGIDLSGAGTVAGTLRQSFVGENGGDGISATATAGVYFTVEESSVIDNLQYGVFSGATGVALEVGASTVGANGTGVKTTAGSVFTFGNNQMSANGVNGSFTAGGAGLQ
jgi:hypothetical protein